MNWPTRAKDTMARPAVRAAFFAERRRARASMPSVALAKMAAELMGFSTENSEVATPRAKDQVGRGPRWGMGAVYRLESGV